MRKIHGIITFGAVSLALLAGSCTKSPQSPGYEYMPDMYRSVGYEAYQPNPNFADGTTAQPPVEGTMPYQSDRSRLLDFMPYPLPNTPEGYAAAAALKNPVPFSEEALKEGEALFQTFCSHCHGTKGLGDGVVGTKNPALIPPAYNSPQLKDLPEGQIFHSITYGKGMMGAHRYQLTKTQRWKLVHYVQSLQKQPAQ
ncbi:MAG: cytochrome c [Flavobacteriales bacterium]|nr:cytochrome c [Flavobacteriales bacterium]MCX7769264.1 cytochrome c [Flavobacteriales bacterium]MDW8410009.1 cytochrome c [Flavobacteriales bacterium]